MGMRYRKSIKIGGVRVNLNKKSIGVSAGVPGFRVSANTKGQHRTTVSASGTGLSYVSQSKAKRQPKASPGRKATQPRSAAPGARAQKPGLFAAKTEKQLFRYASLAREGVARENWVPGTEALATDPTYGFAAATVLGCMLSRLDPIAAKPWLESVFASGREVADDPFLRKYLSTQIQAELGVLPTVTESVRLSRRLIGFLLVVAYRDIGDEHLMVSVIDALAPSPVLTIVRADCLLDSEPERVLRDTEGVTNGDDATAMLLVMRGAAMQRLGHETAALEVFKEALKYPSRSKSVRHRVRYERAKLHRAAGRTRQAREDLEKILAEDADFKDVRELLAQLR